MYEYKLKSILKIYDGDTITVELDLGFGVTKTEKLRLAKINTPEVRGEEREDGLVSRDWLRNRLYTAIENKSEIIVVTDKDSKGKYGRYIAEIYVDDRSVNEELVQEGLAKYAQY